MNYEQIKNRMIESASKKWGDGTISETDAFDPLVSLLFGAFATELESISHEINETQIRVAEKLIDLMNPEVNSGVVPAHALAKSLPTENYVYLKENAQFYATLTSHMNPDSTDDSNREIYFLPAGKFKLVNGDINYLAYGKSLVDIQSQNTLEGTGQEIPYNELFIGMVIPEPLSDLKDLNVYFNQKNSALKLFYHYLKQSKWFIHDTPVEVTNGIKNDFSTKTFFKNILSGKSNVYYERISHIQNYYESNFYTIGNVSVKDDLRSLPEQLTTTFSESLLSETDKDTIWIRIRFPESFDAAMFRSLECSLNVFPVVNLRNNLKVFKTKQHLNLLPLNEEDFFFDINSVENSSGEEFSESASDTNKSIEKNTYILRSDGVESLDNRRTSELITHLLQKLNEESSSFNYIHSATFTDDLTSVNQIISKLEMQLESQSEYQSRVYLFLKPTKENENIFVNYWVTQGKIADKLSVNTKMELFESSPYIPKSLTLITPVRGGKDKKNRIERLYTYRKSLLSRDKIVTKEDIKAFCHQYFGDVDIVVEVKKGLKSELSDKNGFVRVIEINIRTMSDIFSSNESLFHGYTLLKMIQQKASNIFPYRIYINDLLVENQ